MTQTFADVARAGKTRWVTSAMVPRLSCFLLVALALLSAGCGRKTATPGGAAAERGAPAPAPALRKVVLQTDWFPQGEHGGFYQAQAKGFYRAAGLEVDIWSGGPGSGIKLKVAKGEADFGLNRSDDVILAASRGLPLVIVAAVMQHDPMALMVHAASPVQSLRDLGGRTVMGNIGLAYFPYLERRYGYTIEKRQNTFALGEFLANPDLIQQCVVTNEPFFARRQGKAVRTLSLAESGYDCYHTIFTRRELVRDAPDVIRAFVHASIRGWRDYLEGDPAPAYAAILAQNRDMTPELLAFSRSELILRHLVHGEREKGEDIGQISLARIADEILLLRDLKILEVPLAAAQIATKEFLPPAPAPGGR